MGNRGMDRSARRGDPVFQGKRVVIRVVIQNKKRTKRRASLDVEIFWEIEGNFEMGQICPYLVVICNSLSVCRVEISNPAGLFLICSQRAMMWVHRLVLISMISHGIPCSSDENEATGAPNDPNQEKQGFIQALRFHRTKRSGARASRHPPRWRAQSDTPQSGLRRRVDQWQQINPPFSRFWGRKFNGGAGERDSRLGAQVQRRKQP